MASLSSSYPGILFFGWSATNANTFKYVIPTESANIKMASYNYQITGNVNTSGSVDRYGDRTRQVAVGNFNVNGQDLKELMDQAANHLGLFTIADDDTSVEITLAVYDTRRSDRGSVQLLSVSLSESPFSAAIASAKAHLALVPVPAESK
jgi:hypothetical protein